MSGEQQKTKDRPRGKAGVAHPRPASGSRSTKTTVLVWDVRLTAFPVPDPVCAETGAAKLWEALATGKAADAFPAMARLANLPVTAVGVARNRLLPAVGPFAGELTRILDDLGDPDYATRERASAELDKFGGVGVAAVQKRLEKLASTEARARCAAYLRRTASREDAARLADARGVMVLEAIDTTEARKVLEEIAGAQPGVLRTEEARRALDRLARERKECRSGRR